MVVAKSQRAMDALTRVFATHANIRKTYLALVHGIPSPPAGRIENLIGRCPFDRKKMAVVERNGKRAEADGVRHKNGQIRSDYGANQILTEAGNTVGNRFFGL